MQLHAHEIGNPIYKQEVMIVKSHIVFMSDVILKCFWNHSANLLNWWAIGI